MTSGEPELSFLGLGVVASQVQPRGDIFTQQMLGYLSRNCENLLL